MPKMKFGIEDAVGNEDTPGGNFYDGPPPPKGSYTGVLKIVKVGKIKNGDNAGKPRIALLAEITGPASAKKYFGAGIWDGVNVTEQGVPFVNQWLNALTDGTPSAKKRIQNAFWNGGVNTDPDDEDQVLSLGDKETGIIKIGSPEGELKVSFTVRHSQYNGETKAGVGRWLTKEVKSDDDDDDATDAAADADDDDDDMGVAVVADDDDDGETPY